MVTSQGNRPLLIYGYEQIYHGKWFIGVNLQTERGGQQEKTQFISMDYCAF
jgi:hypothetical protein